MTLDPSTPPDKRAFLCPGCKGKILIPIQLPATTGPCPYCKAIITSPPPTSSYPSTAPYAPNPNPNPTPTQPQQPHPATHPPTPAPIRLETPPQPETPATPQNSPIPPRRDHAREPSQKPESRKPSPSQTPSEHRKVSLLPAFLCLCFLIGIAIAGYYYIEEYNKKKNQTTTPSNLPNTEDEELAEANYIRVGWQQDAYSTLEKFLAAKSDKEKLKHILNPDSLAQKLELFYGGVIIDDSDTPAKHFAFNKNEIENRKRGIFLLVYDQPAQLSFKDFFPPLAPLEAQDGNQQQDILLSTFSKIEDFTTPPLRVHAYFKKTDDGLKLDWEIFAQTKYRLFRNFVELPDPGSAEVFRLLVSEDVPQKGYGSSGTRTYRFIDPANFEDYTRINIKIDSPEGRILSAINWRGVNQNAPIARYATIELKWSSPTSPTQAPELLLNKFICWEFLGLGGSEENISPTAE